MTYLQTVDYLFTRLPMFSRIGEAAFKKDLTNTLRLCEFLGNPQQKFKSIHIGGTNGKGSTSHMLSAVFQSAGYKTGLYTSPHLRDFRERIKVNGELVSEEFVIEFVQKMQGPIAETEPSFFEITVAMAFDYFAEQQVDIAIVEVGLGGRLDSTNVITPELSVITNISYDHMNMLGNTLQEIAWEKAGIIKSHIPIVVGEYGPQTADVFARKAEQVAAPLHFADRKRFFSGWRFDKHELVAEVTTIAHNDKQYIQLDLTGIYQLKNLITVLEAIWQMQQQGWHLPDPIVRKSLRHVKKLTGFHGRWEIIHEEPTIVLDVGHNADGIQQVAAQIEITDHEELHIVFGMVNDKDTQKMLSYLPKQGHYYFTKAQIPRALPEDQLAEQARAAGLVGKPYADVNAALWAALDRAGKKDLIVVCGSVFVVGEVETEKILHRQVRVS
jgi:dihydrofolate synthase / folylpolyglutamate synthase